MESFGLLLKSYGGDAPQAERLLESFRHFASSDVPLAVVVPAADVSIFRTFVGEDALLLAEEELSTHLVAEPVGGLRPGYANQEIVKLAFHELELFENYFTVDSEAEFLRPFSRGDFLAPDGYPYSILVEDRDLAVDPEYYRSYWQTREEAHRLIWETVGVPDPIIRTCHGHTTFASSVLRSLVADFMSPRGWTYRDLIELSPYEYTWYNAWLLTANVIPVHPRDPLVKVFHTEEQLVTSLALGIGRQELARGYLAMVINNNFDQGRSLDHGLDHRLSALPHYLSSREAASVLRSRLSVDIRERWRNVFHRHNG